MKSSFSPLALAVLIAGALLLFGLSVLLHAYDNSPISHGSKADPGGYSSSAIGYAGFYDILRRMDRPVERNVSNPLAAVGSDGTLVVAEPDLGRIGETEAIRVVSAPRVLLVLPKWDGQPNREKPTWLWDYHGVPLTRARETLALVTMSSDVFRAQWPEEWTTNLLDIAPAGGGIVQLIRSKEMKPIVGTADGMLVGELILHKNVIWVVSDPDVASNHGIGKGDNAAFMVTAIDHLRYRNNPAGKGNIVFDETVHGYSETGETPVKLLFRFPFVIVTALLIMTAILLGVAGVGRFGKAREPKPPLDFGKAKLIENGARLLDYAGHQGVVLKRFVSMTVRTAGQALHAPSGLDEQALAVWLDRTGKSRGVGRSCLEILQNANSIDINDAHNLNRLFACARDIHIWKGEILNGSSIHRHNR